MRGAVQSIHGLLWAIFLLVVDELGEANAITSFHEGELIGMLRVSGLWLVLRPYGHRNSGRKGQRGASAHNAKQCLKKKMIHYPRLCSKGFRVWICYF
jgi:hypothetical protein